MTVTRYSEENSEGTTEPEPEPEPELTPTEQFIEDLSNVEENGTVTFSEDITLDESLVIPAGVTIDGNGKELKFTTTGDGDSSAPGLHIANDGVEVKNIVIDGANVTHSDNLIEIYNNATLDNVTVKNGEKAGIYVNNVGKGEVTVVFKNVTTSNNAWGGVALKAGESDDKVIAQFNNFDSDESPGVYTEGEVYSGSYEIQGLDGYTENKNVGNDNKQVYWEKN